MWSAGAKSSASPAPSTSGQMSRPSASRRRCWGVRSSVSRGSSASSSPLSFAGRDRISQPPSAIEPHPTFAVAFSDGPALPNQHPPAGKRRCGRLASRQRAHKSTPMRLISRNRRSIHQPRPQRTRSPHRPLDLSRRRPRRRPDHRRHRRDDPLPHLNPTPTLQPNPGSSDSIAAWPSPASRSAESLLAPACLSRRQRR